MQIPERQAQLDALAHRYLTNPEPESNGSSHRVADSQSYLSDNEVIELCRQAKNAAKFSDLNDAADASAYGGDDSRADLALINFLAFYTQDPVQLERLFDASARGQRQKWRNRPDYRHRTIGKALQELRETYTPRRHRRVGTSSSNFDNADNADTSNDSGNSDNRSKPTPPTHDELRDRYLDDDEDCSYGLGEWRRYEEGIWLTIPELTIKRSICEVIEEAKPEGVKPTNSLLSSVTELTRVKVGIPDDLWDADPDILVCKNGALRISTRELGPHRRSHYATSAVPYDYDPKATPAVWHYFMNNTVLAAKAFLQEFAGYALTTNMAHELALWLFGPPGSGKSTFLAGLQAMLGHRSGLLGLAEIERNRFALADLPGKTLVVASEQPSSYLASTNVLNQIISGEPLQVERKYRDPVTIVPRCKIAWAMNELPRVADANSGLFRRVKVVKFPMLPPNERDPEIKRIIEGEGAGILNWALEGLERLQNRGRFEVPADVEEATTQFRENNDVPALFVADRCVVEAIAREKAQELYEEYKQWCEDNGHRAQSSTRLADDWQRLGFERKRIKGSSYYQGVRVRLPGE
jgi:putative DNA primase/helicase